MHPTHFVLPEEKLRKDNIDTAETATMVYNTVGREGRNAITVFI